MERALIAILRGIKPSEALAFTQVLIDVGIDKIEVPLNSPDPFTSIERMASQFGSVAQIGAGTVLSVDSVNQLASVGSTMVVSPNCDANVIRATKAAGMLSFPGVLSPTECFTALDAGADGLKFFPSFVVGPAGVAAMKSVLPACTKTYAVGGVGPENFAAWFAAGISGFGIGSSLYKPGMTTDEFRSNALTLIAAYDACVDANSTEARPG